MPDITDFDAGCATCGDRICNDGEDCTEVIEEVLQAYRVPEIAKLQRIATAIEGKHYLQATRLEELILFSKEMGYEHIGVAFCVGLSEEVEIVCDILSRHFTVSSVMCKVGGVDKKNYDLVHIDPNRFEPICNPVAQAEILNHKETDLNIIFGLCMGHDILFNRFSRAPVTTFLVKDRILAHNTVGTLNRYHRRRITI